MNYVVNLYTKADDNIAAYFKTNHIKADIVINTTDETNKVIGHIDHDVVPPSKWGKSRMIVIWNCAGTFREKYISILKEYKNKSGLE